MSPIEYIKDGIVRGDWKTVCIGYKKLTGETIKNPDTTIDDSDSKDALRHIIEIASAAVNGPIAEICDTPSKPAKKKRGRPKKDDGKKSSPDGGENTTTQQCGGVQLITNEPDPKEIEQNKIKAERARGNKAKLDRQTKQTYDVECNECGCSFKSNRPGGEMGQKCNKCLQEKRSRMG
jgi:hypothetical protein